MCRGNNAVAIPLNKKGGHFIVPLIFIPMVASYTEYQRLLLPIARNLLRNEEDAKDLVQETLLKWISLGKNNVDNIRGYLVRTLVNKCLNFLRDHKREEKQNDLPLELLTEGPSASLDLGQELSLSFLVMLEKLSSMERAVFLLKEVFEYSHKEIADLLGITEENSRQIFSRAKRHLKEDKQRFPADPRHQIELYHRFVRVCRGGNVQELIDILREDIELETLSPAASLVGKAAVAGYLFDITARDFAWSVRILRGEPALVLLSPALCWVFRLRFLDGRVSRIEVLPVRQPVPGHVPVFA